MSDELPTAKEILATHELVEEHWDLKYRGTRVAAPRLKFKRLLRRVSESEPVYPRAATLLREIATEHYFEDGNKRTAWLTMRDYLDRHGEKPADTGETAVQVMKRIRRFDTEELAIWLESGNLDHDKLEP